MVEREITGKGQTVVTKWKAREKEKEIENEREGASYKRREKNVEICCQRAFRAMKMCQIRASMFHRCYSVKSVEKEKKVGGDDSYNGDSE